MSIDLKTSWRVSLYPISFVRVEKSILHVTRIIVSHPLEPTLNQHTNFLPKPSLFTSDTHKVWSLWKGSAQGFYDTRSVNWLQIGCCHLNISNLGHAWTQSSTLGFQETLEICWRFFLSTESNFLSDLDDLWPFWTLLSIFLSLHTILTAEPETWIENFSTRTRLCKIF